MTFEELRIDKSADFSELGEFTGQVVCGVRRGGRTYYPPIGSVYPDVLVETDKFPIPSRFIKASS